MNMDNNDEEWKKRGIEFKIINEGNSKMFDKDQMIFEITVICCHMFMLSWENVLLHVKNIIQLKVGKTWKNVIYS